jgi:hypothetical protein
MSGSGLSYGLNISKKPSGKPQPPSKVKRKGIFDDGDSDDGNSEKADGLQEIGEFGGLEGRKTTSKSQKPLQKLSLGSKPPLNALKKVTSNAFGDLSESLTSRKHAKDAEELDPSIYEFDAVYDSFKPQKKVTAEDKERKPKYMKNLLDAAAVRKRDATIAEEKKLARDREAEGDEFADKEKFVTSAYKKQQEENRRIEEEEKLREEQEAKKNKGAGMTSFYKNMLEKGEQRHAEVVQAVEERLKNGPAQEEEEEKEKTDAEIAREINEQGADIAINDEGQVVDRRQLLKGGLNIIPKAKSATASNTARDANARSERQQGPKFVGAGGGKQAMRERQSRMMETQLEQATKRALEEEEEEKQKVERAAKSRKTEGEIMSAKERYLARKREAEEAKKRGESTI